MRLETWELLQFLSKESVIVFSKEVHYPRAA